MLRGPENALMPNWLTYPLPITAGRVDVVSGTDVHRPKGQYKRRMPLPQIFGPTNRSI